jgi:hypothetical protein
VVHQIDRGDGLRVCIVLVSCVSMLLRLTPAWLLAKNRPLSDFVLCLFPLSDRRALGCFSDEMEGHQRALVGGRRGAGGYGGLRDILGWSAGTSGCRQRRWRGGGDSTGQAASWFAWRDRGSVERRRGDRDGLGRADGFERGTGHGSSGEGCIPQRVRKVVQEESAVDQQQITPQEIYSL